MKHWKLLLFVVALVSVSAYVYMNQHPEIISNDIELGDIGTDSFVYRNIKVKNNGWRTLKIYDVQSCCGTKLPEGHPVSIYPKSSANILARLNTKTASLDSIFKRTITLHTNDPNMPAKEIVIVGKDNTPLKVKTKLNMGYIQPGHKSEVTFAVDDIVDVDSLYLTTSSKYISLRKQGLEDHQVKYELSFDKSIPRGDVNEYIYAKTGVSQEPTVIFSITAKIEDGIRVRPEVLILKKEVSGVQNKTVRIAVLDQSWRDVSAESNCEFVSFDLQKNSDKSYMLKIKYDKGIMTDKRRNIILRNSCGQECIIPIVFASGQRDQLN